MECKLCPKKFSNAKALGAHMKIHYAPLPLPPKTPKKEDITESTICSLDDDDDHKPLVALRSHGLRQNPKKKKRVDDLMVKDPPAKKESLVADDDGLEIEDVAFWLMMLSRDVGKVHKCATCGKVFKSSQGLGSHRAVCRDDHKRMRKSCDDVVLENEMKKKPKIWDLNLMGFEDGDEDNDDDGDGLLDLNLPASADDQGRLI